MGTLGFVYPQYWLGGNAEEDFDCHLAVLKDDYGCTKKYAVPLKKAKALEAGRDVHLEDAEVVHEETSEDAHVVDKDGPETLSPKGRKLYLYYQCRSWTSKLVCSRLK